MSDAQPSELARLYAEHRSIDKVAELTGVNRGTVWNRLQKEGVRTGNAFSEADTERLRREYLDYAARGKVGELAEEMGRTRQFLARKAKDLGLTDPKRPRAYLYTWRALAYEDAERIWDDFRKSSYGLKEYLAAKGYPDTGFRQAMQEHFGDEWDAIIESKAKRSGMYRLGRQVEYSVRDHLKKAGYFVLRSPASRSPIDLLAVHHGITLFIQCKRSGALPVGEWNELFDLALSVGAIPILASRPVPRKYEYYRLDAKKDGSRRRQPMTPIRLWDETGPAVWVEEAA